MSSTIPIRLERVNQRYTIGDHVIDALNDITISIKDKDFIMVMGPSGSGKSTLLNIIAGLETPSSGSVSIDDKNLRSLGDKQLSNIRRYKIGIIFQFFNLHPVLTAKENIELPLLITGVKREQREKKAQELLELVGLGKRGTHYPHELSGGEKQRIGIARALANDPEIILADEPTGDMDSITGREIMKLISDLNSKLNKIVICVTHDEEMLKEGMRLLKMEDGRIISDNII